MIEQLTKIDNEKLLSRIKNLIHAVWDCRQEKSCLKDSFE